MFSPPSPSNDSRYACWEAFVCGRLAASSAENPILEGIVVGPNGAILVPNRGWDAATANGFQSLPTQGLARLKAGTEPTKSLTALQGTVRGKVRTAPEELAVVAGLELAKNAAPVRGPNGVALNVTGFVAKADSPEYEIDATVAYNPLDVQVADTSGMPIAQETIMVQGGGRIVRRRTDHSDCHRCRCAQRCRYQCGDGRSGLSAVA